MLKQKNRDVEGAIECFDLVVKRFELSRIGDETAFVAAALLCRAMAEEESDRIDLARHTAGDAVRRFSDVKAADFRPMQALAVCYKGQLEIRHGDTEAAVETYEDALVLFREAEVSDLALSVSHHLCSQAMAAVESANHDEAMAKSSQVVQRFGTSQSQKVQAQVATALLCRAVVAIESGSPIETLSLCGDIDARIDKVPELAKPTLTWQTNSLRAKALLAQGAVEAAVKSLWAAYAAFLPSNDFMMGDIQELVAALSAAGVSAAELAQLLASDSRKAESLNPLVAALRRQAGEQVRVPDEVLEVAKDVGELIRRRARTPEE